MWIPLNSHHWSRYFATESDHLLVLGHVISQLQMGKSLSDGEKLCRLDPTLLFIGWSHHLWLVKTLDRWFSHDFHMKISILLVISNYIPWKSGYSIPRSQPGLLYHVISHLYPFITGYNMIQHPHWLVSPHFKVLHSTWGFGAFSIQGRSANRLV